MVELGITNNDGADAINETFSDLPEGATVNVVGTSTNQLKITYTGGDGNEWRETNKRAGFVQSRYYYDQWTRSVYVQRYQCAATAIEFLPRSINLTNCSALFKAR
ncbi:MAG: hypothetical protein ABIR24_08595 [Verrucomicrobiota bacterium]